MTGLSGVECLILRFAYLTDFVIFLSSSVFCTCGEMYGLKVFGNILRSSFNNLQHLRTEGISPNYFI